MLAKYKTYKQQQQKLRKLSDEIAGDILLSGLILVRESM